MMRFFENFNRPSRLAFRHSALASLSVAGLLLMIGSASGYQANSNQTVANQAKASTKQAKVADVNAQLKNLPDSRIAELRAFAKTHHPEILPLLDFLEKKRPKKFHKVMAGIDRNISNLERLQKKSPEAYQRGLATWINQSRIKLYAAQFRVAADDKTAADLREKIRALIEKNLEARMSQLARDLATTKEKTTRLQKAVDEIEANREAMIEKKIAAATKNAPRMDKAKKKSAKPTNKAKSDEEETGAKSKAKPKKQP